jgi:cytochrome P450
MDFNPFDPAFRADPYPVYAELREGPPVQQTAMNLWAISRYDDVSFVLKNHALFSSSAMGVGAVGGRADGTRSIISSDPPDHTQLRGLVNRAFTPRMVAEMEPRVREIARELISSVAPSGRMDIVEDLATPLPVRIIAEILGVEPSRREDFKRWSNATIGNTAGPPDGERARDIDEFQRYFADVVDARRRQPQDDLVSALVRAEGADETLTNDEVISFAMLLLIAGNERRRTSSATRCSRSQNTRINCARSSMRPPSFRA